MSLVSLLRPRIERLSPDVRDVLEPIIVELDRQGQMRQEFDRLTQRFDALEITLETLARETWKVIHELTEAQKRTEKRVEELAEAQKRTEERVSRLEVAITELTEAQKRTEEVLQNLGQYTQMLHRRLEGLSNAVGYSLENRAYLALPRLLEQRYGLKIEGDLRRRYIAVGRKTRQINIFGYGWRNGERVLIVGEAKVRPSRSEVQRLRKLCQKLEDQEGLPVVPVFVAHDFPPTLERELARTEILAVWSYDIERALHQSA